MPQLDGHGYGLTDRYPAGRPEWIALGHSSTLCYAFTMKNRFALYLLLALFSAAPALAQHGYHSGTYKGGKGSSHKGGSYKNSSTGNHYRHRK